ncbi:hypothetical protein EMCG_08733 [[Emmonsia] crescens]|uniref:Uncharacterized protein n=1 Tax=[Emmonsia] crescens TaxID=73230 RepID=A0A0G2J405_9EURO|nr:hypothetical protein EMCG_08733 [Emmonsia crescens UAMH 3008]
MRDGQPLVSSSRHFYPLLHDNTSSSTTTATTTTTTTRSRVVSQGLTPMNIEAIRRARIHQRQMPGGGSVSREVSERKQVGDAVSLVSGEGKGMPPPLWNVPSPLPSFSPSRAAPTSGTFGDTENHTFAPLHIQSELELQKGTWHHKEKKKGVKPPPPSGPNFSSSSTSSPFTSLSRSFNKQDI